MTFLITCFLLVVSATFAYSETYSWTDENGSMHFTDNPSSVPKKLEDKLFKKKPVDRRVDKISQVYDKRYIKHLTDIEKKAFDTQFSNLKNKQPLDTTEFYRDNKGIYFYQIILPHSKALPGVAIHYLSYTGFIVIMGDLYNCSREIVTAVDLDQVDLNYKKMKPTKYYPTNWHSVYNDALLKKVFDIVCR